MADLGPPSTPPAIVELAQAPTIPQEPLPGQPAEPGTIGEPAPETTPGPNVPYGPPIHAAAKRGDLAEMEAVANAARVALAAGNPKFAAAARGVQLAPGTVRFTPVTDQNEGAVTAALATLETAIANLKQQQGSR